MDFLTIAFSLALPLALGASVLLVIDWPPTKDAAGSAALRCGYGYIVGALLLTFWMRGLSVVGLRFSWISISLPLLALTAALFALAARRGRISLPALRSALTALVAPPLVRWQRVLWIALIVWLVVHFALMAAEVAWRPLYPWDAWVQWATKARVWYELGHIAPLCAPMYGSPGPMAPFSTHRRIIPPRCLCCRCGPAWRSAAGTIRR